MSWPRDPVLVRMEREAEELPIFAGRLLKALRSVADRTHALTGPAGLLPVHLGRRSLAREA